MNSKYIDLKSSNSVVGGKFKLKELIGKGSFGQVFKAITKGTDIQVAVKLDKHKLNSNTTLSKEAGILSKLDGKTGFPNLLAYGTEQSFNYMVTTLLGSDLENRLNACGGKFSLKTTLILADQILTRIETFHEQGYLHRDIKPQNLLMGLGSTAKNVYLIDFGLSISYLDAQGQHIKLRDRPGFVGTARYASWHAHMGCELSRRDDLESIGYMLVYFLKGKLPWQSLRGVTKKEKYTMISHLKSSISPETLCKGLPKEFANYLQQVKSLEFADTPNYKGLRKLFRTLLIEKGFDCDYHYSWLKRKPAADTVFPEFKMQDDYSESPTNIKSFVTAQQQVKRTFRLLEEEQMLSNSNKDKGFSLLKSSANKSEVDKKIIQQNENLSNSTNRSIDSNAAIEENGPEQENPTFLNLNTKPFNNLLRQTTTSKDESTRPGELFRSFKEESSIGGEPKNRGLMKKQLSSIVPRYNTVSKKRIIDRSRTFKMTLEIDSELSSSDEDENLTGSYIDEWKGSRRLSLFLADKRVQL